MFTVYILRSESKNRFYVGHTANLRDRFERHNQGRSLSTRSGRPWTIFWIEEHASREAAMARERQIKSWKSSEAIWQLIERTA